jgi:hypothetical protein
MTPRILQNSAAASSAAADVAPRQARFTLPDASV